MRRLGLPGPFTVEELGEGRWRLVATATAAAAPATEVYLHVLVPRSADLLKDGGIVRLELHWQATGVTVTVNSSAGTRVLQVHSAIVHQPRTELYQSLPLAGFDRKARTFWWRVFALMRIPGGRLLLRMIARRRR